MLGLKLDHVSKSGPWQQMSTGGTEQPRSTRSPSGTQNRGKAECYKGIDSALHLYSPKFYDAYMYLGQVTKLRLFCYLVLLSIDSKTR